MVHFSVSFTILLTGTLLNSSSGFLVPKLRVIETPSSTSLCLAKINTDLGSSGDDLCAAGIISRRKLLNIVEKTSIATSLSLLFAGNEPSFAFDGSGASASSGNSPSTKAQKKKKFQERVVADVKDFNRLGQAIDNGDTKGPAWINFFIPFQRREPDEVGRTYAALADLRGVPTKKANEYEGGDGLLLANTFTKPGKPPDNTPAVKYFLKLSKTFDAIEAAGKAGDASKAKTAWLKTSELLSQYLADVELPGDLKDPLYKP